MTISEFVLILLVGVLSAVFIGGCDDGEDPIHVGEDHPNCNEDQEGDVECRDIGAGWYPRLYICIEGLWGLHYDCSVDDKYCIRVAELEPDDPTDPDPTVNCVCRDPGTRTRCSDDWTKVEICNVQADWEEQETCDEGTVCQEVEDDVADCVPGICVDRALRCTADNRQVEVCRDDQWTLSETCTLDQTCRDVVHYAQCVPAEEPCTTDLDALRCNPNDDVWIQECRNVGTMETPKMEWRDSIDCSLTSADEICIEDPNVGTSPTCGLP